MIRWIALTVVVLVLLLTGLLGTTLFPNEPAATAEPLPQLPVLADIEELTELVALRVVVTDVLSRRLGGYVGGMEAVLVVHGYVELGVDLDGACFENVDQAARIATLVLPAPRVRNHWLDPRRTRIESMNRTGLWHLTSTDQPTRKLVAALWREASEVVAGVGDDPPLKRRAKRRAEQVLQGFMSQLGWEVTVRWAGG